jgi:hypothetical protein
VKIHFLNKIKQGRSFQINTATSHENRQAIFIGPAKKTDIKIKNIHAFIVDWQIPEDPSPMYA